MFLHSGASLHGHEYHRPPASNPSSQRRKPFLRSSIPPPILRSATVATTKSSLRKPSPDGSKSGRRPLSEVHVRPLSDALSPQSSPPSLPNTSVVRFKDLTPLTSPTTSMHGTEDDRSCYDSDASQATTSSAPRRRRRRTAARAGKAYLMAVPPPKLGAKNNLLTSFRPRLLLQLQELAPNQRPRPCIDVFPASLLSGPLASARYKHCSPRLFGIKGELGPRDLVLVKSEDYTTDGKGDNEAASGRRRPVAVFSPSRGQDDAGEMVLDNGSVWAFSKQKGYYSFVHKSESGSTITVRWVKRNSGKGTTSAPVFRTANPSSANLANGDSSVDSDYRYTFSIINPLLRRHPILATLTPQSLEVYNDYTTTSSSQGRYPPSRPISCVIDSASGRGDPPLSPTSSSSDTPSSQRETVVIDDETKKLIRITGLWLALRLGPPPDNLIADHPIDSAAVGTSAHESSSPPPANSNNNPTINFAALPPNPMPRRQTTSNVAPPPPQPGGGLRRAMTTGAAFMQRRRQRQQQQPSEAPPIMVKPPQHITSTSTSSNDSAGGGGGGGGTGGGDLVASGEQKQSRRVCWLKFKKQTH